MQTLEVEIKYVFGTLRIYPRNDIAKRITKSLLSRTCLSYANIKEMQELGYKFKVLDSPSERAELVSKIEK